jgi:Zn-dependent peptidase ImmA (M78 family)/DNA-binding XRE family transcriptional regulator
MIMNIADKLRSARKHSGLTQEQVSDRCGIDDSSLSSFENGKSEPRLSQLSELGEVYHLSLNYFFEANEPQPQLVLWRNAPENGKEIEAEFLQLCRQYRQLEIWTNNISEVKLPPFEPFTGRFWYPQVEEMAHNARVMMGLGDRPGESLHRVLEEVSGVKIFCLDLGSAGVAACAVSTEFGSAILLNSKCAPWRRNHDLAHELFHLLTWKYFKHTEGVCEASDQEEKFATCFAGNLLLPAEPVRLAIYKSAGDKDRLSYEQMDDIAREFDVSLESLIWRMHYLFNYKESATSGYLEAAKEYVQTVHRKYDPLPADLPERYRSLAIKAFRNGDISKGRFAKLMEISRMDAEQFTTGREPANAEVPILNT